LESQIWRIRRNGPFEGGGLGFAAQPAPVEGIDPARDLDFDVSKSPGNFCLSIGDLAPARQDYVWARGREIERKRCRFGGVIIILATRSNQTVLSGISRR